MCLLVLAGAFMFTGAASGSSSAAKLSAHLTKKSFTASQAGSVKLVCTFWKTNTSYVYKLRFKQGSKWQTVRTLKEKETVKGHLSVTVKRLFGGKPIKLGSYRVTISGNFDIKTLGFTVVKAPPSSAPPTNSALPTISGTAKDGQTLTASPGSWAGSPPLSYSYQWRRCGASGASCSNIAGAGSGSYLLAPADVGSTIRVVVTGSNSAGSATASSAQTGVVAGLPPTNSASPAITGTLVQGQTLSASPGTWSVDTTPTYSYQWQSCDTHDDPGVSCWDISGATGQTYGLVYADVGGAVRVRVTATTAYGSASAYSDASADVAGLSGLPAVDGTALVDQTLSVESPAVWTNSPGSGYQWQRCDALGENCVDISGETSDSYTLVPGDADQTIRATVSNFWGEGPAVSLQTMRVASLAGVSAGWAHSCAVVAGTVQCWGGNGSGQLGNNDVTLANQDGPVEVVGPSGTGLLTDITQVSAGYDHTCALKNDGTVWCWGDNAYGELGNGAETFYGSLQSLVPVQVLNINNATQISAGYQFTCARLADGFVKCWGNDIRGQCGTGTPTTDRPTPGTPVAGIDNAVEVATGGEHYSASGFNSHACARLADGTVKCWGYNEWGQLGIGDPITLPYSYTPAQVLAVGGAADSKLEDVIGIDIGVDHSCAVLFDGTVACWGYDGSGQLGYNEPHFYPSASPVLVVDNPGTGTLGGVTQVSAGGNHTCARLISGSYDQIWCWGDNSYGQLGEGGYVSDSTTPVRVLQEGGGGGLGFLTDTAEVSAGGSHSCARMSNGGVKCWGRNNVGQLGNNDPTHTNRTMPVTVYLVD